MIAPPSYRMYNETRDEMATYDFRAYLSDVLTPADEERLFEMFEGDVTPGIHAGEPVLLVTLEAASLDEATQRITTAADDLGVRVDRIELDMDAEEDALREQFSQMLGSYGNVSELARRSGLSRRAIEYKRDGTRRVTQWDVWALEAALHRRDLAA